MCVCRHKIGFSVTSAAVLSKAVCHGAEAAHTPFLLGVVEQIHEGLARDDTRMYRRRQVGVRREVALANAGDAHFVRAASINSYALAITIEAHSTGDRHGFKPSKTYAVPIVMGREREGVVNET